ncbi:MAG: helix-turn-helix domain-containing protein [Aestuariivita sp.]|nr:helix-turn-helix domain-containing protein [Aestuariivita sp.]MCY4152869.1 helix-turn-helix domain-containing protein [Aestuariivita sp.]
MTVGGRKLYKVTLTEDERTQLQDLVDRDKGAKERRKRAHILLLADTGRDRGGRIDADIADALGVNVTTVERVRKRCVMAGLDAALDRKPHPNPRPRLLDGEGEATLTMLACSQPPAGQASWTLELLGDRLVALNVVDTISKETVRRTLKKTTSNRGCSRFGACRPRLMRISSMPWRMCCRFTNGILPPTQSWSVWMRPRSNKRRKLERRSPCVLDSRQ